jgi:hypothetical protein
VPVFKIIFEFEFNKNGWSETHYAEYENSDRALIAATEVANIRFALLGGGPTETGPILSKIRVSNVAIQRDALVENWGITGANKRGIGPGDNPNLAIEVRKESGDLYRATLFLRGQPDVLCVGGIYQPHPEWGPLFDRFRQTLIARQWGIYAVNRPVDTITITDVQVHGLNGILVTTAVPHGLVAGNTVRIISAPGTTGVRGTRTVFDAPSNTTFVFRGIMDGLYRGGGKLYARVYQLKRYTNLQIEGITRRATGGPIERPVGRRRRRVGR